LVTGETTVIPGETMVDAPETAVETPEVVEVLGPVTTSPAVPDPLTHDTIRIEARHLVARGDTPVLQKWLRDLFDVEAISMIPEDRLHEAYVSVLELVKTAPEPAAA
jgi:hypothetical protein